MKKVSNIMANIIGSIPNNQNIMMAINLSNHWRDIVGEELCNVSSIEYMKYTCKNKAIIYINVLNTASVLLKYKERSIEENICTFSKLSEAKIIFKQSSSFKKRLFSDEI